MSPQRAWRISVVGTAGAGKTTTARQIAQQLKIPHVELDALYWGPDWTPTLRRARLGLWMAITAACGTLCGAAPTWSYG